MHMIYNQVPISVSSISRCLAKIIFFKVDNLETQIIRREEKNFNRENKFEDLMANIHVIYIQTHINSP